MTDPVLDKLIDDGDIASYTHDISMSGGEKSSEYLAITFPSGAKLTIQTTGNDSLMFWDE